MIPRRVAWQAWVMVPALVWFYGWRTIDTVEWRTITAAPFTVSLDPAQQFLYGSPLTFLLGSYYQTQGLGFEHAFAVVHGLGLVLLAVALFRALTALCSTGGRAAGAIVLAGSPLLFVVLTWIGKSDAFLLAFYLLLVSSSSRVMQALLCVLMMGCHRELALAMLAGHVLLRGNGPAVTAGAALGTLVSLTFTNVLLDPVPVSRLAFALGHTRELLGTVAAHPFTHLVATLGPFWLYVCRPSALDARRAIVLGGALLLACLAYDFTRVFVIAATPLLLVLTQEVVAEIRRGGGVMVWRHRVGLGALAWLAFAQIQVAGAKVLWVRGLEWALLR